MDTFMIEYKTESIEKLKTIYLVLEFKNNIKLFIDYLELIKNVKIQQFMTSNKQPVLLNHLSLTKENYQYIFDSSKTKDSIYHKDNRYFIKIVPLEMDLPIINLKNNQKSYYFYNKILVELKYFDNYDFKAYFM